MRQQTGHDIGLHRSDTESHHKTACLDAVTRRGTARLSELRHLISTPRCGTNKCSRLVVGKGGWDWSWWNWQLSNPLECPTEHRSRLREPPLPPNAATIRCSGDGPPPIPSPSTTPRPQRLAARGGCPCSGDREASASLHPEPQPSTPCRRRWLRRTRHALRRPKPSVSRPAACCARSGVRSVAL